MPASGPQWPAVIRVVRDDAYIKSKHTSQGALVRKELAKGKAAHIFHDDVDLEELERKVWTEGVYQGQVGKDHRATHDRFVWQSPASIGRRIQHGQPDLDLFWVEIKGKITRGVWVYHLAPRRRPAGP